MGPLDGKLLHSRRQEQSERADPVEVTVIALLAHPIEKGPRISLSDLGPEIIFPARGRLQQRRSHLKRVIEARAQMTTIDADDDPQLFAGRIFFEESRECSAEPMKFPELVPLGEAFNISMKTSAKNRHETKGRPLFLCGTMKAMKRLNPNEWKFDRMFALMRGG